MKALLTKNGFILAALLFSTFIFFYFRVLPFSVKIEKVFQRYYPLLQTQTPTLELQNKHLTFRGNVPQTVHLDDGVVVVFAPKGDVPLPDDAAEGSAQISETAVRCLTAKGWKEFFFENLNIEKDPLVIEPIEVKKWVDRFLNKVKIGLTVSAFAGLFLLFSVTALLAAAIGFVIDAFRNGPYSFKFYFGSAVLLLTVFIITVSVLSIKNRFGAAFFLYLVAQVALTNLVLSFEKQKETNAAR